MRATCLVTMAMFLCATISFPPKDGGDSDAKEETVAGSEALYGLIVIISLTLDGRCSLHMCA